MTAEDGVSFSQRLLWITNLLYHQILAVISFYVSYAAFSVYKTDNKMLWHIFWTTFAYIPLMGAGIILFAESTTWTQYIKRTTKYYIHGGLLLLSCLAVTVGIAVEIINKNSRQNPTHFKSDHAITGLVSWVLCLLSIFLGLFSCYSQKLKQFIPAVWLKLIHNFFGVSGFAIGIASLCLGFKGARFLPYQEDYVWLIWLTAIASVYSVIEACRSMYYQFKSAFF